MKKEMSKLWLFYVINKLFKNLDLLDYKFFINEI
jgi:hypothetical protein